MEHGHGTSLDSTFCMSVSPIVQFYSTPPPTIAVPPLSPLCLYCLRRFRQIDFIPHIHQQHAFVWFPCNECFIWFNREVDMERHLDCYFREAIRDEYNRNQRLLGHGQRPLSISVCQWCSFCAETKENLTKHIDWCHRQIDCKDCHQKMTGFIGIRLHPCLGPTRAGFIAQAPRFDNVSGTTQQRSDTRMATNQPISILRMTTVNRRSILGTPSACGTTSGIPQCGSMESTNMDNNTAQKCPTGLVSTPKRCSERSVALRALPKIPRIQPSTEKEAPAEAPPAVSTSQATTGFHYTPISSTSSSSSSESDNDDWTILKRKLKGTGAPKNVFSVPATSRPAAATSVARIQARKMNDPPKMATPAPAVQKAPTARQSRPAASEVKGEDKKASRPVARDMSIHKYFCLLCPLKSIYKQSIRQHINGKHQISLEKVEQYYEFRKDEEANDEAAGKDDAGPLETSTPTTQTRSIGVTADLGCPNCKSGHTTADAVGTRGRVGNVAEAKGARGKNKTSKRK